MASKFLADLDWIVSSLRSLSSFQILAASLAILALYAIFAFIRFISGPQFSFLRKLPAPKDPHWLAGHWKQIDSAEDDGAVEGAWMKEFGHVYTYKGFLNMDTLWTTDIRAIQHILSSGNYQKPSLLRNILTNMLGNGLLVAEGNDHKNQRRIMNPAFHTGHLREMTDVFVSKSAELRDVLLEEVARSTEPGAARIEIISWLSRATLDIIGLAGFNYSFDALRLGEDSNELSAAFFKIFSTDAFNLWGILKNVIPWLKHIPFDQHSRSANQAQKTMRRIGLEMVREKQNAIRMEKASAGGTVLEKGKEKDLLSLLIRANMDDGLAPDQRLSVEDILNQIPTFLVAGHETTATSTTWALFALAQRPEMQAKLRAELREFPHESPNMDDLNSFPYLEAVVRETLRFHPAASSTSRIAVESDILPLSKPFQDVDGVMRNEIRLSKGEEIEVPIAKVNKLPEIWGPDAEEFNPDRWLKPIPGGNVVPGVWGNMLSFLGGSRSCIGFRFALVEMKALMFHLIRSFEFELAVPVSDVGSKRMIVSRPYLKSEKDKGNQLPMIIRPISD